MALNTVKAISERRSAKAKELNAAFEAIGNAKDEESRSKAEQAFDGLEKEYKSLSADLERARRIESLAGYDDGGKRNVDSDDIGNQGLQNEERDSPLINPDAAGYSLMRAIRMRADGQEVDGVEGEIHQELAKRAAAGGKPATGFMIPHTLRIDPRRTEQRSTMTTTQGSGTIPTIVSGSLIDVLRHRMVMQRMGAIVLSNMVGSFAIPKKTATNSFEWVAEDTAATGSRMTIGQVTFSEKTISGHTRLSRSLLKQSSQDVEAMARMDLVDGLAVGLDLAGLANASGGDGPTGLLYVSGIPTVAIGTNGGAPTHAALVQMETEVFQDDADVDNMGYVVNAKTRGKLKTTLKEDGIAGYLWESGNTVNGYNALTSNQLPSNLTKGTTSGTCSAAVFGNFADAVFALWGGMDMLVDPYTEGTKGNVLLVVHQSADFNVRRTESFSRCLDLTTV